MEEEEQKRERKGEREEMINADERHLNSTVPCGGTSKDTVRRSTFVYVSMHLRTSNKASERDTRGKTFALSGRERMCFIGVQYASVAVTYGMTKKIPGPRAPPVKRERVGEGRSFKVTQLTRKCTRGQMHNCASQLSLTIVNWPLSGDILFYPWEFECHSSKWCN